MHKAHLCGPLKPSMVQSEDRLAQDEDPLWQYKAGYSQYNQNIETLNLKTSHSESIAQMLDVRI